MIWLIALDKHPGVRPIAIGEVSRRIISKVILTVVGDAGQEAESEAGVKAMVKICEDANTEAACDKLVSFVYLTLCA